MVKSETGCAGGGGWWINRNGLGTGRTQKKGRCQDPWQPKERCGERRTEKNKKTNFACHGGRWRGVLRWGRGWLETGQERGLMLAIKQVKM